MNLLITGGTGFIGKHLLSGLKQHYPDSELILLCRRSSDLSALSHNLGGFKSVFLEDGIKSFYDWNLDAIIHLAADYGTLNSAKEVDIYQINEVNVQLGLKLLGLAQSKAIHFLYSDTFFVEADKNYPYMVEYIRSKRYFFECLQHIASQERLQIHNLRLFHPFGEGDNAQKFFPTMIKKCLQHENIDLTEGLQQRDFIYIDDVVQAFIKVLQQAVNSENAFWNYYEVGYGEGTSVRQLMEWIKKHSQSASQLNFGAIAMRPGEFVDRFAVIESLQKIGWKPQFSVESGIEEAIKRIQNT